MFKVQIFSEKNVQYLEVTTVDKIPRYFKAQHPFDLVPIDCLPTIQNKEVTNLNFSMTDIHSSTSIEAQVIRFYRRKTPAYRAIWNQLGGDSSSADTEILMQFSDWIQSLSSQTTITLNDCDLSFIGLRFLRCFKHIKTLTLNNCSLNDRHLDQLFNQKSPFPSLTHLDISNNSSIRTIPFHSHIKRITLNNTGLNQSSKRYLEQENQLEQLIFLNTPLSKALQNGLVLDEELEEEMKFHAWLDFVTRNKINLIYDDSVNE